MSVYGPSLPQTPPGLDTSYSGPPKPVESVLPTPSPPSQSSSSNIGSVYLNGVVPNLPGNHNRDNDDVYDEYIPSTLRPNSSANSSTFEGDSDVKDETMSYWEGLISTVGQENELNRIFNAEQAILNREFNRLEAEKSRSFNASEAEKSRQWSEIMSNTAYQRAVLDLQKAGLNPILAYQQGGASSPSSSSASSSPASGQNASYNVGGGDTLSDLLNTFGSLISSAGDLLSSLLKGGGTKRKIGF